MDMIEGDPSGVREVARDQLAKNLVYRVAGGASCTMPGVGVPPLNSGDMAQSAAADYRRALDEQNPLAQLWVRRAAHAERFADAMEQELEAIRKRVAELQERADRWRSVNE
jgi:hypothetical protein